MFKEILKELKIKADFVRSTLSKKSIEALQETPNTKIFEASCYLDRWNNWKMLLIIRGNQIKKCKKLYKNKIAIAYLRVFKNNPIFLEDMRKAKFNTYERDIIKRDLFSNEILNMLDDIFAKIKNTKKEKRNDKVKELIKKYKSKDICRL